MSYRCQHYHSHMMPEYYKSVVTVLCSRGEVAVVVAVLWSCGMMVVVLQFCGVGVVTSQPCGMMTDTSQPCGMMTDTSQSYSMAVVMSGHVV